MEEASAVGPLPYPLLGAKTRQTDELSTILPEPRDMVNLMKNVLHVRQNRITTAALSCIE